MSDLRCEKNVSEKCHRVWNCIAFINLLRGTTCVVKFGFILEF